MPGTQDQPREDQTLPCGWKPTRSKVASEIPKTKDTGLLPRHGISKSCELKGCCTLCSSYLKKKRKEAKRKWIPKCLGVGRGRLQSSVSERWPGSVAYGHHPSTREAEAGGLESPASLGYSLRPHLNKPKQNKKAKEAKGQKSLISGVLSPKE